MRRLTSIFPSSLSSPLQMYDSAGNLLASFKGMYSIIGNTTGVVSLAEMAWQPMLATENAKCLDVLKAPAYQDIAAFIKSLATKKRAFSKGPCVIRVMEFIQAASVPSIVPALVKMEEMNETDIIIETYTATHDHSISNSLEVTVPTEASNWLRTRIALLPVAMNDLKDFSFDIFLVHDCSKTGSGPWTTPTALVKFAWDVACPGAVVMVGGLEKTAENEELIGATEEKEELLSTIRGYADAVKVIDGSEEAAGGLVAARFKEDFKGPDVAQEARRVLLCSSDEAFAKKMADCLIAASAPAKLYVDILLCGPGHALTDESTDEEYLAAMTPFLKDEEEDEEEEEKEGGGGKGKRPYLQDMIFLDGLTDESNLCAKAFYRFLRLGVAGHYCFEAKETAFDPVKCWILTANVFSEPINIGRASLYGISRHFEFEMQGVLTRYVDVSSLDCVPELAALIISRPTERTFKMIPGELPLVQRFNAVSRDELAHKKMLANDPHDAYYVDVAREKIGNPGQVGR